MRNARRTRLTCKAFAILLLATIASGQRIPKPNIQAVHYPEVIHADVPLYPPIARAAHITGTVEIQVVVEKGSVVSAQLKSVVVDASNSPVLSEQGKKKVSPYLSIPSLANVKTWRFDSSGRITFLVRYVYRITGQATPLPESPTVELDFPHLVKITARPFSPTCSDCGAPIGGTPSH